MQCLAKITYLVPRCVSLLMLSVLWLHFRPVVLVYCAPCRRTQPMLRYGSTKFARSNTWSRITFTSKPTARNHKIEKTVSFCTVHNTHAHKVKICRHNTDINNDTHIGTRYVILAKHWMWLRDGGFMWTETCWSSFYNFNYFNNLEDFKICVH